MHRIRCAEIWGGIGSQDADVCSKGITASMYCGACDGGKGGDIYYLSVCEGDMLTRIALADVMGHGQAVSDVSGWLYSALESHMNDAAGNEILSDLNALAIERGFKAITTAAIIGYNTADSYAYFSYAGHHAMLVRRCGDGDWTVASLGESSGKLTNVPLGVDPEASFTQDRIPLSSGDRMFLYTDGVIEAPDKNGDLYGEARLMASLRSSGSGTLTDMKSALLSDVRSHTGGPLTHDDVTLLAVEVN